MAVTPGRLSLYRDISACTAAVEPPCSIVALATTTNRTATLNDVLYIGGVPSVSPFVRSKLTTTRGFQGCLGVRNLASLVVNYMYIDHI